MLKEQIQKIHLSHVLISFGLVMILALFLYIGNNRFFHYASGRADLSSSLVAEEDNQAEQMPENSLAPQEDLNDQAPNESENDNSQDANESMPNESENDNSQDANESMPESENDNSQDANESMPNESENDNSQDANEPMPNGPENDNSQENFHDNEDNQDYQDQSQNFSEEDIQRQIKQMERDYKNWTKNLKGRENDLERADKLISRFQKDKDQFEKQIKRDNRAVDFNYDDYVNWSKLEEIKTNMETDFNAYKTALDEGQGYVDDQDTENFYKWGDKMWISNIKWNVNSICLNIFDRGSNLVELMKNIADYKYEIEKMGGKMDENITNLESAVTIIMADSNNLCGEIEKYIEDNNENLDLYLSLTDWDEKDDLRMDIQDIENGMWDYQDNLNDKFDAFEENDPWWIMDQARQSMDTMRQSEFIQGELANAKSDISAVKEVLTKIEDKDENTDNQNIATEALANLDQISGLIDEIEKGIKNDEDVFNLLQNLQDIANKTDELIRDLDKNSLEKYLTEEEIKFLYEGPKEDNRQKFKNIGMNDDMAQVMSDQISEEDALKLIQILLQKVDLTKFQDLINSMQGEGSDKEISVIINAMEHIKDDKVLETYIDNKKEILSYIDKLSDDKDLRAAKTVLEDYNFAGPTGEEVIQAIEDYLNSSQSDEDQAKLTDTIFNLREEDIKYKRENGVISFGDVLEDTWYYSNVEDLKEKGIVSGKADGNYDPAGTLTNAEILKIALEATGNAENLVQNPNASHWVEKAGYVAKAQELGINFNQNYDDSTSRGYVLYLLEQVGKIKPEDYSSIGFPDVSINHQYADYIEYARLQSWISGDDDTGNFRPDDSLNRAEAAKIVGKFLSSINNSAVNTEF
ncbi:MAG: hypothetical protein UR28_C0042G0012 [Candidatus Peregrinibacteria bacterium GW2011_GWF2_33_10]|nr:MAG: hypothetical protein UR28_C0042G0012 [Candidatus Peregrinibacteria bacterium GW2011_GWF2_33_10]